MMMLLRQLSYAIKTQLKTPKAPTTGISSFHCDNITPHCRCNYVQLRLYPLELRILRKNLKAARLTELTDWNGIF